MGLTYLKMKECDKLLIIKRIIRQLQQEACETTCKHRVPAANDVGPGESVSASEK